MYFTLAFVFTRYTWYCICTWELGTERSFVETCTTQLMNLFRSQYSVIGNLGRHRVRKLTVCTLAIMLLDVRSTKSQPLTFNSAGKVSHLNDKGFTRFSLIRYFSRSLKVEWLSVCTWVKWTWKEITSNPSTEIQSWKLFACFVSVVTRMINGINKHRALVYLYRRKYIHPFYIHIHNW